MSETRLRLGATYPWVAAVGLNTLLERSAADARRTADSAALAAKSALRSLSGRVAVLCEQIACLDAYLLGQPPGGVIDQLLLDTTALL